MSTSKVPILVSASWLKEQITSSDQKVSSKLRVLDAAWKCTPLDYDGYKDYQEQHIPTAVYFDLKKARGSQEGNHEQYPIPKVEDFKEYVQSLGISNDTHVVIYDEWPYPPSFRLFFLFKLFGHDKVSILNGCFGHWKSLGYPTSTEEPKVERGNFEPKFHPNLLRDFEAMKGNVTSKSAQVIDTRFDFMFNGGKDGSGGYVPDTVNIPFVMFIREDGLFKEGDEIKEVFAKANIDLDKPTVSMCQIGFSACVASVAALIMGKEDLIPIYNGSFNEWFLRADPKQVMRVTPIEK